VVKTKTKICLKTKQKIMYDKLWLQSANTLCIAIFQGF
jgi:hypothetical protein